MKGNHFPVIDLAATGKNIIRLRTERGLTVRDLQAYFGFEEPQAIYKWQQGKSLPTVDNLYALGALLEVPMEEILVSAAPKMNLIRCEQQADACCSLFFCCFGCRGYGRMIRCMDHFRLAHTICHSERACVKPCLRF
ncbi:MAG: helix-turn-helix domain-containing protein [Oscillospiraceae bacterium]|nr:helix-turn-helix domain-containing protein [Oscillospiraceae bacterium]